MNDLIELKLITSEDENMTLVDYVKSCIKVRRFKEEDAKEVRNLIIVRNFMEKVLEEKL